MTEWPEVTPRDALSVLQSDFAQTQEERTVSQEDLRFLEMMDAEIKQMDNGHLMMPLPFKSEQPWLPSNKKTALSRLAHLKKRFQTNAGYYDHYKEFMKGIIGKGDAERADNSPKEGHVWYIPHHGVYHPKKPEKIRVVFDCSARHGSESLNGHLLTGPDLINHLTGVLYRFRKYPVPLMCDIERMFHEFMVKEEHRDYLQFLWWEQGDLKTEPVEYMNI